MNDSVLLTTSRIFTFHKEKSLSNSSGFFFERNGHLFLVTCRHVVWDEPTQHFPDRIEIELHNDIKDMAKSTKYSIPLYENSKAIWRQGIDSAGEIDVAVIEIDRTKLPAGTVYQAFTLQHLADLDKIEIGTLLLVVGFPLGFHDTLHHMPVVRHAISASSFGLRFQGNGYFLTDARTHRGTSGAPVVMRNTSVLTRDQLPWTLLGIHSARLDVDRDQGIDEALGLNCAWYADIILKLTEV